MATCFRSVTHKLNCTNYLKAANLKCSKNSALSLRRPMQHVSVAEMNVPVAWRAPEVGPLYLRPGPLNSNGLVPFTSSDISSHDIIMWYRRENGIDVQPPIISEYERDAMSRLGAHKKNTDSATPTPESEGRASEDQLAITEDVLAKTLPKMFTQTLYHDVYHENIILENNIRGMRTVGVGKYMTQAALLRVVGHFKFAYVKFQILKITKHPENSTIKCRWRIVGISGLRVMFRFWELNPSNLQSKLENAPTWYDGFSIYHVSKNGKIYKHVIDKMMPDDDKIGVDPKAALASKVAMYLRLMPKEKQGAFLSAVDDYMRNSACLSQAMFPLEKM